MSAAVQQKPQLMVKLNVVKGPHAGQVFQLSKSQISIGRGPENDVVLLNDPQVSRAHAQLVLVDRDFEIVNLSKKNAVFVNGENVDRWKLVNQETFIVGDSEFKLEYDLGQAVASVPAKKMAQVVPIKVQAAAAPKNQALVRPNQMPTGAPKMQRPIGPAPRVQANVNSQARTVKPSLLKNSRVRFYGIIGLVLAGFLFFMMSPGKSNSQKAKSILKYEDEIDIKLNSKTEKELVDKREELVKSKESPQKQRADENFIKGMRDFQLGNYSRAMDFFQVVLNLQADHALARRHLYLAKVRFDELIQAKLMLGDSYYKKHNFSMCESMYRQVLDMLGDKKTDDPKFKLAESKTKECRLAAEGIR
ncbi:MAG: FHA domain-containing protein [Bdellovibrio sp.]|nr:FHA domain-containing protein [Bdellovibrio sp.]